MAEGVRERINRYIEDAIAAERNFEDALHSFGTTGVQAPVRILLARAGDKARTQHERLTALLESRGGSPSEARSLLAHALAFSPLSAQIGHGPAEKNTQHLIVTYAAAAAEQAMYRSLAEAASEAGDTEVESLARQLQSEEKQDAEQVWPLLAASARDAFMRETASGERAPELMRAYLEDTIAAEKSFESQLRGFSKEGDFAPAQNLFAEHAEETREQHERLTSRLKELGGSPSTVKSVLAHFFSIAPKTAQVGQDASERVTQNLMMANAVENAEIAMYEVFATVSAAAGDGETRQLALSIQGEERAAAERVWGLIAPAARRSIQLLSMARAS